MPSISKTQQSLHNTSKAAKNGSTSSFIMSDHLESNIPLGISSLKSNANNDDTSESKSNEAPISTPEFIETPLLSKYDSTNARDFSSTSKSALSTFKRVSPTIGEDGSSEPKRDKFNTENKTKVSSRIENELQVSFW